MHSNPQLNGLPFSCVTVCSPAGRHSTDCHFQTAHYFRAFLRWLHWVCFCQDRADRFVVPHLLEETLPHGTTLMEIALAGPDMGLLCYVSIHELLNCTVYCFDATTVLYTRCKLYITYIHRLCYSYRSNHGLTHSTYTHTDSITAGTKRSALKTPNGPLLALCMPPPPVHCNMHVCVPVV